MPIDPIHAAEEPNRPLRDWLVETFDLAESNLAVRVVEIAIEPALKILVILIFAGLAAALLKRAIRRAVARAKEPGTLATKGLRERVGLVEGADTAVSARRGQRVEALGALANSIVSVVVGTVALFMILGIFDINLGPLIAGAGIVGVAVGFGAQSLVRDFLTGVFMLLEDQYGVGDIINAGEAVGVVEAVTLRTTRIRDVEGTLWHIPNGEIARVGNMSQEWARALLDVAVAYGTDVDVASELIHRVASEMASEDEYAGRFLGEPEIWGVQALGDNSVDIRLVIKTLPGEQWAIARQLRRRLKNAFDAAGIEIPFPQRTTWLRTELPVALGDGEAPGFEHAVPDEALLRRAVAASKRRDGEPTPTSREYQTEADRLAVSQPPTADEVEEQT